MAGSMIKFPSNGGETKGYLSLPPSGSGPGLLVIQEWWGLVQHIKNMADRYAARGFVTLAPDLYHGEAATEPDHAMTLMHELEIPQASKDLIGAAEYLRSRDANSTGKVGCLGYCMGGGMTLLLASKGAIQAAAPFYGVLPSGLPDPASIQCPVQGPLRRARRRNRSRTWHARWFDGGRRRQRVLHLRRHPARFLQRRPVRKSTTRPRQPHRWIELSSS